MCVGAHILPAPPAVCGCASLEGAPLGHWHKGPLGLYRDEADRLNRSGATDNLMSLRKKRRLSSDLGQGANRVNPLSPL